MIYGFLAYNRRISCHNIKMAIRLAAG